MLDILSACDRERASPPSIKIMVLSFLLKNRLKHYGVSNTQLNL